MGTSCRYAHQIREELPRTKNNTLAVLSYTKTSYSFAARIGYGNVLSF